MRKIIIPIMALTFCILLSLHVFKIKAEGIKEEFKINSEFKCPKLKLKNNTYILDYKYEDINGDGIKEDIILTGHIIYEASSPIRDNIKLIIRDRNTDKYYSITPGKADRGVGSRLFVGDFDGDKIKDVLIAIGTGGSGGCSLYSIISFKNNKYSYLIDEEKFSKGLGFKIKYEDDFKVNIFNKITKKTYVINAENKRDTYTNLKIYNEYGKLMKKTEGGYDGIGDLLPVDIDKDGVYELKVIQAIWGIAHVDTLGYGKSIWKYKENKMQLQSFELLEFASPGGKEKLQRVVPVWAN